MTASKRLALARLQQQFRQAPWLKWAMLLIFTLVAVHVLQLLQGALNAAQQNSIDQEVRLGQVQALRGQEIWFEREQESANIREGLAASIPDARTAGVAQAALQGWVSTLGNSVSDTRSVRISVEPAGSVDSVPGVVRVRATLRAGMSARKR